MQPQDSLPATNQTIPQGQLNNNGQNLLQQEEQQALFIQQLEQIQQFNEQGSKLINFLAGQSEFTRYNNSNNKVEKD